MRLQYLLIAICYQLFDLGQCCARLNSVGILGRKGCDVELSPHEKSVDVRNVVIAFLWGSCAMRL